MNFFTFLFLFFLFFLFCNHTIEHIYLIFCNYTIKHIYSNCCFCDCSPHPYIFFNFDHESLTFLGFNIDEETGNLLDPRTQDVLKEHIIEKPLYDGLLGNFIDLQENFDDLAR